MKSDIRNPADAVKAKNATVFLDGVRVEKCVMADEENGVVEIYETNEHGRVFLHPGEKEPRSFMRYGVVRIEFKDSSA